MPDSTQALNAPENAQNPPVTLSAEQAEVILRADFRNLAKKVQQGKTLSVAERNLLQSYLSGGRPSGANFVANQVELAEVLGVNRKTIQRALKTDGNPGACPDGRYDVNAWRIWLQEHRGTDDAGGVNAAQERARNILLRNTKLEADIAITQRQWMPVPLVEQIGGELGAAIRKVVTQIHLCAPSVVGLSVPDAEARLKEIEDEILSQLHVLDDSQAAWRNAPAS